MSINTLRLFCFFFCVLHFKRTHTKTQASERSFVMSQRTATVCCLQAIHAAKKNVSN